MQKKHLTKFNSLMIKILSKPQGEENVLNPLKNIYKRPRANIINCKKSKSQPVTSEPRQGCPISAYLFNIVLEVQVNTIRQAKKIKIIQI